MAKQKKEGESKICYRCNRDIKPLDRQVDLITKDKDKVFSIESFHFKCWRDEFDNAVRNKLKAMQKQATKKVFNIMDILKDTMKSVGLVDDEEKTRVDYKETEEESIL